MTAVSGWSRPDDDHTTSLWLWERYRLTVRAVNAWGQQGDPASVSFRIARTGSAVAD